MTGILNARVLASVAMLVFVGAAIAASTGAFFSDTESSTGNTFTAGDVDITISDLSHTYTGDGVAPDQPTYSENGITFALGDLKPLDEGTVTYTLGNGTNDAYLCAAVVETGNNENTRIEPETEAGDTTDGAGNGELGQFLSFMFGSTTTTLNGQWQSLGVISANGSASSSIGYCFGTYVGGVCQASASPNINRAQTDSVTADVQFYAVQTRNNPNFSCTSLPPATGTTTAPLAWVENGVAADGDATVIATSTNSGNNALRLTTIDDVNSRVRYSYDIADINASAFTGFSFDSKQVKAFDSVNGNASFRLVVDLDGNLGTTGDVKDVTYEPYYNILAHNSLNDASITPGMWQNWAATQTEGKFWAGGVTTVLGPSEGAGGAYATNFTIAQLVAAYPSAKIVGISIGMGTYNKDQIVLVDNLIFNGSMLGFE
jgi:predicted ribosomally synthesized peptide with SipW-like signal peptide